MKVKKNTLICAALLLLIMIGANRIGTGRADETGNGCLNCHQGIESIMPQESGMMLGIDERGDDYGFGQN